MTQMILEISDGTHVELTPPLPIPQIDIDQGRGPQGPPGLPPATMGDVADLETEDKSSIVAAINELNMTGVSWLSLYHNAKAG